MKKLIFLFAILMTSLLAAESSVFDKYLKEATDRCHKDYEGSFLCDAVGTFSTMKVRNVSIKDDPYARMILCSSFALATKYERYDVYEGTDVALAYKSNGEIAWVLLTNMKQQCGNIAKDILKDRYIK